MKYKFRTFAIFLIPALLAFCFIVLVPFIKGLYGSFTNWKSFVDSSGESFNGLDNYKAALRDDAFTSSFAYTIEYTLVAIVLVNLLGLMLAMLLQKAFRGRNFFRSTFFMPNLIGGLVLGYAWQLLFTRGFESLGLHKWLTNSANTFWALQLVTMWQYAGYMMIIFVAALQNLPEDQIEAAKISGASRIKIFRKIVIPNLMPAFTVTLFLTLSRAIKIYALSISLTKGVHNSSVVAVDIYNSAFRESELTLVNHIGIAQAKAMIFTLFISALAILQVGFTKRREISS